MAYIDYAVNRSYNILIFKVMFITPCRFHMAHEIVVVMKLPLLNLCTVWRKYRAFRILRNSVVNATAGIDAPSIIAAIRQVKCLFIILSSLMVNN